MSSKEYWRDREEKNRKKVIKNEKEYVKQIKEIYQDMLDEIEKEINGFYARYARKEGISMSDARKKVSKTDIEKYERLAKKYVKEKNFSKRANEQMRLYNLTMKVNRLELLKAQISLYMVSGFDDIDKYFNEFLTDEAINEIRRAAGVMGQSVTEDIAERAKNIVDASFKNATFSERIWMYQDMLRDELNSLLQSAIIQGQNPNKLAKHLSRRFDVSMSNAQTLMITEVARVQTDVNASCMNESGFEEYEFIAEPTACPICRAIDGKHYKVSKMVVASNAPPMHPNCRCAIAPYIQDDDFDEFVDFIKTSGFDGKDWNRRNH